MDIFWQDFFPRVRNVQATWEKFMSLGKKKYLKIWKTGEKRTKKNFSQFRRKLENNYLAADPGGGVSEGPKVAATWKKASWLGWTPPPVGCLPTLKKPLAATHRKKRT